MSFQRVLGDPMLSQQEARLKEMIALLYESVGKCLIEYNMLIC